MRKETINVHGILVTIEYRKVKNVNLYVKPPDGQVLVTAPGYVEISHIHKFLESKEEWILKTQEKIRHINAKKEENVQGEPSREQMEELERQIQSYAKKWEPVLGVHAKSWTLRKMKTRWGSCTIDTAKIRINTYLVHYPVECLEYVVVHELCHLLEAGHTQRFWAYVEKCLPDWKIRRMRLKGDVSR